MRVVPTFLFLCCFLAACSPSRETVKERYALGRDQTWFPVDFGEKTAPVNGFTNALVQEIAQETDVPLHIHNLSWEQLFTRLDQDEVAGIFTSITPNVENQKKYQFSESYLDIGPVLVVEAHSPITSLEHVGQGSVGVSQYDDSILILQKFPSIHIELYQNMPSALDDLVSGKLQGVLLANLEAHAFLSQVYKDKLKIVTPPLNEKGLRVITKKGEHKRLIHSFNEGLTALKSAGRYSALLEKYDVY